MNLIYRLIKYLINQLLLNQEDRVEILLDFFPQANGNDWDLFIAGQRVQIIKQTQKGGILKLGTEVVAAKDGSLAALLGASPGASTAVTIMLKVLQVCSAVQSKKPLFRDRLRSLLPSLGTNVIDDVDSLNKKRARDNDLLGFNMD